MEVTKEELEKAVIRFKNGSTIEIPLFDSDGENKKKIGHVVDMEFIDDHIEIVTKLDDDEALKLFKKCSKGIHI